MDELILGLFCIVVLHTILTGNFRKETWETGGVIAIFVVIFKILWPILPPFLRGILLLIIAICIAIIIGVIDILK